MNTLLFVVGTRPEAIKILPVYCAARDAGLPVFLCSTGQHADLLADIFTLFGVRPDTDLAIAKQGQDLFDITQTVLSRSRDVFAKVRPGLVVVQGDTTTAFACALAAFYMHIPVAHVEAGLRTFDIQHPFPEEFNRRVLGLFARYHFAPTALAAANVLAGGVAPDTVFCTGNTVVDALHFVLRKIETKAISISSVVRDAVYEAQGKQLILFTMHRRESFDGGITRVLMQLKDLIHTYPHIYVIYPQHPNPHVQQAIEQAGLRDIPRLRLLHALAYPDLVYILSKAHCVMTDSGGIQEEAISLGKPVVVLREKTERIEGVWQGMAVLAGTDSERIKQAVYRFLTTVPERRATAIYGDGFAALKIVSILKGALQGGCVEKERERKNL